MHVCAWAHTRSSGNALPSIIEVCPNHENKTRVSLGGVIRGQHHFLCRFIVTLVQPGRIGSKAGRKVIDYLDQSAISVNVAKVTHRGGKLALAETFIFPKSSWVVSCIVIAVHWSAIQWKECRSV